MNYQERIANRRHRITPVPSVTAIKALFINGLSDYVELLTTRFSNPSNAI